MRIRDLARDHGFELGDLSRHEDRIFEDVILPDGRENHRRAGTLADDEDLRVIRNLDVRDLGIGDEDRTGRLRQVDILGAIDLGW